MILILDTSFNPTTIYRSKNVDITLLFGFIIFFINFIISNQMNCQSPTIQQKQIQIINNRLYFLVSSKKTKYQNTQFFEFNVDDILKYEPFHFDFGPLKISCVYQYVEQLTQINNDKTNKKKKFIHITSTDPKKYCNSIFLICCYMMIGLGKTPEEAYQPFKNFKIIGFRDSSSANSSFQISILDCLKGLYKALKLGWFSMSNFSIDSYQYFESTENGDINQIIPQKLFAFSAPSELTRDRLGKRNLTSKELGKILKNLGVELVIHFEKAEQFSAALLKQQIESHSLPFAEYTVPEPELTEKFLAIMNKNQGRKIAINCKTGLGKVGTMIGYYLIKNFSFTAVESMSWIRLCRPGSIVGHQQDYLVELEKKQRLQGNGKQLQLKQESEKKSRLIRKNSQNHRSLSKKESKQLVNSEKRGLMKLNSLKPELLMPEQLFNEKIEPVSATIPRKTTRNGANISKNGFNVDDFLNELRNK